MKESFASGACARCGAQNPYRLTQCTQCGNRLPWADALENASRTNEYRFRTVFESNLAPLGFWHVDGRVLDANEAFLQMVGYSRDELEAGALRWDALTVPEHREYCRQSVEEIIRGKASTLIEKEYLLRDGRRIPVLVSAALLPDSTDCGVAVILDISQRRQIERELDEKEEQYLSIFNAAQDGFIITDLQGKIVEANPQACHMHGYTCEEFIGLDSICLNSPRLSPSLCRSCGGYRKGRTASQ
jgi:PAS domain S-box-containing protein